MKITKHQIDALYAATEGAYSFSAYKNWRGLCAYLLRAGFSHEQSKEILLSKWTRWAGDSSETRRYGKYTSTDLKRFIERMGDNLKHRLDELMAG